MQKTVLAKGLVNQSVAQGEWLDLQSLADVELTSEALNYPVEQVFRVEGKEGWRAAEPGRQTIRLRFAQPLNIRHIYLEFSEPERERTQEFAVRSSSSEDAAMRDVVRQQWTFSPGGSMSEVEDYTVQLDGVRTLELVIDPDQGRNLAVATLRRWLVR